MPGKSQVCRVVVVGGGPVGLGVAALLASGRAADRLDVHVVDSGEAPSWHPESIDLRVYALARSSQRILARAGAWDLIRERRVSPYRRMRVWQGDRWGGAGSLEFDCADIGEPDLGHIVEDQLVREALVSRLTESPNVHYMTGATVTGLVQRRQRVDVELSTGSSLKATLVVAADGADSPIRSEIGIGVISRDYRQQAIVTHIATERPHEQTAWQRFLPGGPLAFLPLLDGRSSIVWSLPDAEATRLAALEDRDFVAVLQTASGDVLGPLEAPAARALFPLLARHASRYCIDRVALAGDAAHCVHPLAGQGMNLGLSDAAVLATVIEEAIAADEDAGDLRVLRRYERGRKGENLGTLLALDAIERLFGLPSWAAPASAFGLGAVECMLPAKRLLMRRALGLHRREARPRPDPAPPGPIGAGRRE